MRSVRGMFFRSVYLFSNKPNYFKLFDLPFDFTEQQLKNSYLELVKKYHPDLTKDPAAAEVFKQIQAGYEVLSDQTKRREHQKQQVVPGDSSQETIVDEMLNKFYKRYQRKDQVNDEFNFSYKLFKEHYQKVETPKGAYKRYEGQAGDEYYAHKQQKGEKSWKQVAAGLSALAVLGAAYTYTHW